MSETAKDLTLLISHESLQQITGYSNPCKIGQCLDRQGVRYFTGSRGRIWTTQESLNAALGLPTQPVIDISHDEIGNRESRKPLEYEVL